MIILITGFPVPLTGIKDRGREKYYIPAISYHDSSLLKLPMTDLKYHFGYFRLLCRMLSLSSHRTQSEYVLSKLMINPTKYVPGRPLMN